MAENTGTQRFDWLSNVGAFVRSYGRVRLYALILGAFGETWESDSLYELRVSDGTGRWYPAPVIPIEESGVHDVLAHLHAFSSELSTTIAEVRAVMNEDRTNAGAYYGLLELYNERYRAVEAAVVELEEELFAAD